MLLLPLLLTSTDPHTQSHPQYTRSTPTNPNQPQPTSNARRCGGPLPATLWQPRLLRRSVWAHHLPAPHPQGGDLKGWWLL